MKVRGNRSEYVCVKESGEDPRTWVVEEQKEHAQERTGTKRTRAIQRREHLGDGGDQTLKAG